MLSQLLGKLICRLMDDENILLVAILSVTELYIYMVLSKRSQFNFFPPVHKLIGFMRMRIANSSPSLTETARRQNTHTNSTLCSQLTRLTCFAATDRQPVATPAPDSKFDYKHSCTNRPFI